MDDDTSWPVGVARSVGTADDVPPHPTMSDKTQTMIRAYIHPRFFPKATRPHMRQYIHPLQSHCRELSTQ